MKEGRAVPDDMREASEAYDAELEALADLDDDQLDYLARLGEIEDGEEGIGCEHDEPKLTEEEWAYVEAMNSG